ncbi:MAG: F0F1 ATP synthase subunit delta [Microgenomates group bacterium]
MELTPALKLKLKSLISEKVRELAQQQVVITSAVALSDSQKKDFAATFPKLKGAPVTYKHDSSLIAGFVIEFGSSIIDASLASQIDATLKN